MVEELKLAIKIDDDAIEQSLLKQFSNAEKMANKVVLTFNNIDLDDKAIEAKFKEMQKMAGKNPIDLSIDKSSIEMLSAISKQLGNIFDIAKGKSIIDSSATAQIDKLQNKLDELTKKYDELSSKKIGSTVSGKDIDLVDNTEFKRLSDEFSLLKDELTGLKREMQLFEEATVSADTFVSMERNVNGLIVKVDDLIDKYVQLSVVQKNFGTGKLNISSGTQLEDVFQGETEKSGMDAIASATDEAVQAKKDFVTANEGVQSSIDGSKSPLQIEAELMDQIAKSAREAADAKKEFVEANKQVKDSADASNGFTKKDKYKDKSKVLEDAYSDSYFASIANKKLSDNGFTILGESVNTELVDGLVKVNAKIKTTEGTWKTFSAKIDADGNMFEQRFRTITKGVDKLETELENFGRETSPALTYQETLDKANEIRDKLQLGGEYSIKVDSNELVTITKKLSDIDSTATSVTQTFKSAKDAIQNFGQSTSNSAEKTSVALKGVKEANKEVKKSADNSKTSISEEEKYFNSLGTSLTQYQNTLTSISRKPTDGNRSQELQEKIDIISSSLKELETLKSKTEENGYIFNKNDVDTGKQLEKTIKENIELVKQMSAAQRGSDALSRGKEIDTITKYLNKFTGISKEAKHELNGLLDKLQSGDPSVNVKKIHERFLELTVAERNAGREARNLFDIFKDKKIYSFLGQAASMFSFYDLINYGREGISTLKEFDDGLTKISYTMDMTKSKLNDLGKSVLEMANDLDSSIDNAMQVSQIYANMNTSAEEIKKLSEPTLILSNLTGFDASTVADDIQAVTQQFEIAAEDSMHIADVYDQISRNISVDYGKGIESIAEAVQVAGSTANQAGLSFEQLAAIVGKTAEKTRLDGSQIGNGLKTIMTRLSKVGELSDEVDPETLSDASESLHKIGIEVYNADGSFRKFDVIMGELANKWDTLSDAEKSNISFSIAATRQTNLLSSILSNFSDSMSMAEEATNANGNALENNQKWVDSFSGRLQALENTAKSAWINILDSETLATGIDLLNGLLKVSTEIINTFGALPTVFTTGGIGAFIANFTWPSMATNNYNLSYSF